MPISEWISKWYLEEVKEKPLSQKRAEAIERGKETSILEKLSKKLGELQIEWENDLSEWYAKWVMDTCETLRDFLTSLETPQFTPWQEETKISWAFVYEPYKMEAPNYEKFNQKINGKERTPTPWQMIEVSNDGERWYKKEFTHTGRGIALADKTIYFYTTWLDPEYNDGRKLWEWWKFARPIEDKIEPELPEFSYDRCDEENNLVEQVHEIGVQVEALTTFCQALARQKTTK